MREGGDGCDIGNRKAGSTNKGKGQRPCDVQVRSVVFVVDFMHSRSNAPAKLTGSGSWLSGWRP